MGQINILSPQIANKIAAGEVIERPVSVVKELLENAIDAGADTIDIQLQAGGMRLIQVTDNGSGMTKDDLPLAFERHATSKISDFNDLFALHSFGFRGEALASIATVSQASAISGTAKEEKTWKYTPGANPGEAFEAVAPRQGTQIEVRNLFYNVPARRKFVKSESYEFGQCAELFSVYATAYPQVTFTLSHNNQLVYTTVGRDSVEDRFVYFRSADLQGHLLHLEEVELAPGIFTEAWMSDASVTRNNRKEMTVFVNGRWVKSKEINTLIENAYHTYIPKGRFPSSLLLLTVPPDTLDVNIHPAKTTVKIAHPGLWQSQLEDLVRDVIWKDRVALTYTPAALREDDLGDKGLFSEEQGSEATDTPFSLDRQEGRGAAKGPFPRSQQLPFNADAHTSHQAPVVSPRSEVSDQRSTYQYEKNEDSASDQPALELESPILDIDPADNRGFLASSLDAAVEEPLNIGDLHDLQVIGQLNNTFILAQSKKALYIIDQHTCHERILYDAFMAQEKEEKVLIQHLLHPFPMDLTPREKDATNRAILALRDMGIIIEVVDEDYSVVALPAVLVHVPNIKDFILEILDIFEENPRLTIAEIREKLLTTRACKSAVKANWPLSHAEQHALIQSLAKLSSPRTCPHGRPIFIEISMNDLYLFFKRGSFPG